MKNRRSIFTAHKKGWIADPLICIIFFLFVPACFAIIFAYISTQVCATYQTVLVPSAYNMACGTGAGQLGGLPYMWDEIIPVWFMGSFVACCVLAAFLRQSPILIGAMILYMLFAVYASFYLSNVAFHIISTPPLNSVATHFPNTLYLVAYMPVELAVMMITYILISITKYRSSADDQQASMPAPTW